MNDNWKTPGYGNDSHGGYGGPQQGGYGGPHPGGGYPPPPQDHPGGPWQAPAPYGHPGEGMPAEPVNATPALVTGILITVLCCSLTNIIAIVLAALAMNEKDPDRARSYVRGAWISNWIHLGLIVLGILVYGAFVGFVIYADSQSW